MFECTEVVSHRATHLLLLQGKRPAKAPVEMNPVRQFYLCMGNRVVETWCAF